MTAKRKSAIWFSALVAAMIVLMGLIAAARSEEPAPDAAQILPGLSTRATTLDVGHDQQGWQIVGEGACHPGNWSPWIPKLRGRCTVVRWAGDADGTLIRAGGAGWRLADMTLLGWARHQDRWAPGCDVGLHVTQSGSFNGAKALIERVAFAGFRSAVLVGERGANPAGNDNLRLEQLIAHRCGAAIEIASPQACSTTVEGWHARANDCVLLLSGGGDVVMRDGDCNAGDTLVRVTARPNQLSHNNGAIVVDRVKIDPPGDTCTILDQQTPCYLDATFRDLRFSTQQQSVRLTLRGEQSRVLITDCKNLPADTRFTLLDGARLTIRDCDLRCDPAELLAEGSRGTLLVRDCWRETHAGGAAAFEYIHHARVQ